jgi:hypothetical protein
MVNPKVFTFTGGSFTGAIDVNGVLTVTSPNATTLAVGEALVVTAGNAAVHLPADTIIQSQISGSTGVAGTYQLYSQSGIPFQVVTAQAMTTVGRTTTIITGNSQMVGLRHPNKTVQVYGSTNATATVSVQGSLDGVNFTTLNTTSATAATAAITPSAPTAVMVLEDDFPIYRLNVSAISGTAAAVGGAVACTRHD